MTSNGPGQGAERRQIAVVLASALALYLVGWAVVALLFGPERKATEPESTQETEPAHETAAAEEDTDARESVVAEPPAPQPLPRNDAVPSDAGVDSGFEARQPDVGPGETPVGVELVGGARYESCWERNGLQRQGEECDRISGLEERFGERLWVVERCRQEVGRSTSYGDLEIGMEVDFSVNRSSFWNGQASDIPKADDTARCLGEKMAGFPTQGMEHRFDRYWVFLTVRFSAAVSGGDETTVRPAREDKDELEKLIADGKIVNVARDRVRVRKTPLDGEILGMIGTGSRVTLIQEEGEWCRVATERGNVGWMVCWGLEGFDSD